MPQPVTVEAAGHLPVEGETIPRRNIRFKDRLISRPEESVNTVFDIVKRGAERFGNAKCMGWRDLIRVHTDFKLTTKIINGEEQVGQKLWAYFELSEYKYISFLEYEKLVLNVGAGLRKLGLEKGDRVHFHAATSHRWLASMHGAVSQSMSVVTSYETLGEDGLLHSLVATRARAIYTDPHLLKSLVRPLKTAKDIEYVIYNVTCELDESILDQLRDVHPDVTFISFDDLCKLGDNNPTDPVPPSPDDLCCIMYTSGSTGLPKGVPLKHKMIVAAVAGADSVVGAYISPSDHILAYLPLAHIFEFVFENASLYWGSVMGYANPRTLTDTSVRNCKSDLEAFRPTLMVGVPMVWETVRKGVMKKVGEAGFLSRNLFWGAYYLKRYLTNMGLPGSIVLDSVVFKKVTAATGGRLRFTLSGAGPISKETREFISLTIAPIVNGYGLTETTAMAALCDPWGWTNETLGNIPACIEVKLVDYPDAGYFAKSNPPQGEILIRGYSVMEGYYDNAEATSKAIVPGGWFRTEDIGEFDKNGCLKVIDRKKNLVKTLNGEYIAIEKLESVYRSFPAVDNICIYAAPNRAKAIAVVVASEASLRPHASLHGIQNQEFEQLVQNKRLRSIMLQEMQDLGRKSGLTSLEIIEGLVLVTEPWTPQNGLTSPAQKINRRAILEKYKDEVDKAYQRNG